MYEKMTIIDSDNKEVECNIIASWHKDNNNYLAYTDGTKTNDKLDLYVSKYIKEDDNIKLIAITDEEEWQYVNKYIEENVFGNEEDTNE